MRPRPSRPLRTLRIERLGATVIVLFGLLCAGIVFADVAALRARQDQRRVQLQQLRELRQLASPAAGPVSRLDGLFAAHRVVVTSTPAGRIVTVVPSVMGGRW